MCTAHPAKFRETLEDTLNRPVKLPEELEKVAARKILSIEMPSDYNVLRDYLLRDQSAT